MNLEPGLTGRCQEMPKAAGSVDCRGRVGYRWKLGWEFGLPRRETLGLRERRPVPQMLIRGRA